MLLEYLIEKKRKRVVLFVPKAARKAVWERTIDDYAPHLRQGFSSLRIFNHTDLSRVASEDMDFPRELERMSRDADVVVIDEAHHFRNLGYKGTGERIGFTRTKERPPSRYYQLYDLIGDDQAGVHADGDAGQQPPDRPAAPDRAVLPRRAGSLQGPGDSLAARPHSQDGKGPPQRRPSGDETAPTDLAEAERRAGRDPLFEPWSCSAAAHSSARARSCTAARRPSSRTASRPQVAEYSVKKTYGKLLEMVEDAFQREKPLFSLAIYYPFAYWSDDKSPRTRSSRRAG